MTTTDPHRLSEPLMQEERRVAELVRSLRHTHGLGEVARRLSDLRVSLETRFLTEETPDGFFDMISDRGAVHLARVQACREEHIALIDEIDLVLDRVRACLAGPMAEIVRKASRLADRIEQHEARERKLLGDAMSTDFGAGTDG